MINDEFIYLPFVKVQRPHTSDCPQNVAEVLGKSVKIRETQVGEIL